MQENAIIVWERVLNKKEMNPGQVHLSCNTLLLLILSLSLMPDHLSYCYDVEPIQIGAFRRN